MAAEKQAVMKQYCEKISPLASAENAIKMTAACPMMAVAVVSNATGQCRDMDAHAISNMAGKA
ncbi:hypothetical protein [Calycomorphotria hydatis]|uniref:hypothetical protein n=1 Tax=Calycomorphotria hydatis TaxID=2528027 RepID=UPI0018D21AC6|nr:hypothetical protein [Calycomorphotria hydatis]